MTEGIAQHNTDHPLGILTVHKFGGTSVAGSAQYRIVASIIDRLVKGNGERPVIVVSAMSGITNRLYESIACACCVGDYVGVLKCILDTHHSCLKELFGQGHQCESTRLLQIIQEDVVHIEELLTTNIVDKRLEICPDEVRDIVVGYGEIWSSKILSCLLCVEGHISVAINAREFLILKSGKDVRVDWDRSVRPRMDEIDETANENTIPVITGFLATSHSGIPTTLKRNGSDFSGAIIANLFDAAELTIWTDVDGIYSADPRTVSGAKMLQSMSYREAAELAYFGAKVIHPQTMAPCVSKSIPIVLRNTFNLDCMGTLIGASTTIPGEGARAVTIVPQIALVNVEGSGLFGFAGIAAKLFGAVAAADVNIIMITQASSEYSICFAVPFDDAVAVGEAVCSVFSLEIFEKSIDVSVDTSACIIAAVGDNMHKQIGLLGKLTSALGAAGVNIRAIAQGSSERNITFVVNKADGPIGLRCLHDCL